MDVEKALAHVSSKETFIEFLVVLRDDYGSKKWKNGSIDAFLEAMQAWASAVSTATAKPTVSNEPTWKGFAEILRAGALYE